MTLTRQFAVLSLAQREILPTRCALLRGYVVGLILAPGRRGGGIGQTERDRLISELSAWRIAAQMHVSGPSISAGKRAACGIRATFLRWRFRSGAYSMSRRLRVRVPMAGGGNSEVCGYRDIDVVRRRRS